MLLRCLLGGSWGLLQRLGRLLGPLRSLSGASGGILGASWRPLGVSLWPFGARDELVGSRGGLFGASWGGLAGLGADKWPWLERVHDFDSSQGGLLGGKVALAAAGARFW